MRESEELLRARDRTTRNERVGESVDLTSVQKQSVFPLSRVESVITPEASVEGSGGYDLNSVEEHGLALDQLNKAKKQTSKDENYPKRINYTTE